MTTASLSQSLECPFETSLPSVAIIGGSGFYYLDGFDHAKNLDLETPYGAVNGLQVGVLKGCNVVFLTRHGGGHKVPPHKINYRANIWALKSLGVEQIIAVNAVGGLGDDCAPGALVIPDQIIDYTYGREHTFADILTDEINHIEFSEPYSQSVRCDLLNSAALLSLPVISAGCYACTQGPRLESTAEISRLKRDGNTLVGMTAMPEAALAREQAIGYASICIVANWGAGLSADPITLDDIHQVISGAVGKVQPWLHTYLMSLTGAAI